MKRLKIILLTILFGCYYSNYVYSKELNNILEEHTARITYYAPDSKFGTRVAAPNVSKAQEGITVAAHPKFKFGTKIYIPQLDGIIGNGMFVVQDRGPAVTKKVASRGKAFVFDIFVASHTMVKHHAYSRDMFMKIYVIQ